MLELKLEGLGKRYKEKMAVDHVDLLFTNGIYGLLGANGAGKTTLLRMICNILRPSEGEVLCNGSGIQKLGGDYRSMLGYLPQEFGYYPDFTAWRYMMYLASLKALPKEMAREKCRELLELVGLLGEAKQKIKTFSGGMIRRLGIAQALLNDPEILILDEPTAGLDPKERIRFRNIISALSSNRIVILSTHIVSDIAYIADRILIMKQGRIIKQGVPDELIQFARGSVWECLVPENQAEIYNRKYAVSNLKNIDGKVMLRIIAKEKPLEEAVPEEPNLEDVYLYFTEEAGGHHENF